MSFADVDGQRRVLLQGVVASSVAYAVSARAAERGDALPGLAPAENLLLIVEDSPAGAAFTRGVQDAVATPAGVPVLKAILEARLLETFSRLLQQPGRRVVGFVDDACGVLLIDAARGSSGRLRWHADIAVPSAAVDEVVLVLGRRLAGLQAGQRVDGSPACRWHPMRDQVTDHHHVCFVIDSREDRTHGST